MKKEILLVGCGKMGAALINGWLKNGIEGSKIIIVEPSMQNITDFSETGISHFSTFDELKINKQPDFIIFAVKPNSMDLVLPAYKCFSQKCTFISIAAGKTLAYLEGKLGSKSAIIRAMPNTPAMIQRGTTVICGNRNVGEQEKYNCLDLLSAIGYAKWITDEEKLDIVTAISGSGPAYVFLLAESLRKAGVEFGLDQTMANELAINTVAGSGEMLRGASDDLSTLRENVTSPGGTTEAALSILMSNYGLQELISKAVNEAINRSRELGK